MNYVIVGLGNPDTEYKGTRHNVGRAAVQLFAKENDVDEWREDKKNKVLVVKVGKHTLLLPETYMNKSGSAVVKYVKSVKAAKTMVVVYDDMDLPLGRIKISFARSSGGHKGVESIRRGVKTDEFIRVRIGVSPTNAKGMAKKPLGEEKVLKFILGKFAPKEENELKKALKRAAEALGIIIDEGYVAAMNKCN